MALLGVKECDGQEGNSKRPSSARQSQLLGSRGGESGEMRQGRSVGCDWIETPHMMFMQPLYSFDFQLPPSTMKIVRSCAGQTPSRLKGVAIAVEQCVQLGRGENG